MDTSSLMNRVMRVIRFDASVYREIAADSNALPQALIVMFVSILISSIGSIGSALQVGGDLIAMVAFVAAAFIGSLIGFALFAFVAALVAQNFFQGKTSFNEMARTLGFTYIFQVVGVLGLIPCLGGLIALLGVVATIAAAIIALRESAEFDTTKAAITAVIAGLAVLAINFCIGTLLGGLLIAAGLIAGV
jgi:hypothetical protein